MGGLCLHLISALRLDFMMLTKPMQQHALFSIHFPATRRPPNHADPQSRQLFFGSFFLLTYVCDERACCGECFIFHDLQDAARTRTTSRRDSETFQSTPRRRRLPYFSSTSLLWSEMFSIRRPSVNAGASHFPTTRGIVFDISSPLTHPVNTISQSHHAFFDTAIALESSMLD